MGLDVATLMPAMATVHERAGHRSTTPYVLGAIVIAILAIALTVQLIRGMKRTRRGR
jgi:hypothetical protein